MLATLTMIIQWVHIIGDYFMASGRQGLEELLGGDHWVLLSVLPQAFLLRFRLLQPFSFLKNPLSSLSPLLFLCFPQPHRPPKFLIHSLDQSCHSTWWQNGCHRNNSWFHKLCRNEVSLGGDLVESKLLVAYNLLLSLLLSYYYKHIQISGMLSRTSKICLCLLSEVTP